jgi:phospholipase A1
MQRAASPRAEANGDHASASRIYIMTDTKRRSAAFTPAKRSGGNAAGASCAHVMARLSRPCGRRTGNRHSCVRRGGALIGLLVLAMTMACDAHAQLARCASLVDDRERLACYDALAREQGVAPAAATSTPATPPQPATELQKRWELRPEDKQGIFQLRPYRPLYALVHWTTNTNESPSSPTRPPPTSDIHLDSLESKLQLSLKSKLVENVLGGPGDLWFGYTQQSYWQAANTRFSSPFRETDYEPEVIYVHPLSAQWDAIGARYAAISFTHQSNGRGESLSRSWNRVIGEAAFESGPWSLQLRPWVRVHERSGSEDDNPDIDDYIGRGEAVLVYRAAGHVVTLTGRHTLRFGDDSRGAVQLDWAFPLTGSLNGHLQVFSGYGESLIDYNHRQTTFGLGVSFFD